MKINESIKSILFFIILLSLFIATKSEAIEFNTDVLNSNDKANIDFSRFAQKGYIYPGDYQFQVLVNKKSIKAESFNIRVIERNKNDNASDPLPEVCITPDIIEMFGMTDEVKKKIRWWHSDECADFSQISGVTVTPDISSGNLDINMPQSWLEYMDDSWLPPSRWDDGIPGVMFDYNVNANKNWNRSGTELTFVSYNGTSGMNFGPWRFRADYQGNWDRTQGDETVTTQRFDWTRFYLYRAIRALRANLMVGENYINSDIFSSWSYVGASLSSDDRMLPPNLRGYAPEITGIAETNARVVVRQQNRIIYDSTVPAGPFTIQDLNSSVQGQLDVEIIEQDGRKRNFTVNTSSVPYLTRPGQLRYKIASGRPRTGEKHNTEGPAFINGEASLGITNNWSLYGGFIAAKNYDSLAVGAGRDLGIFGTLSIDLTQSQSHLNNTGTKKGKSWRVSYSKRFDKVNADLTFAGYRFSERNYLTMSQYLGALRLGGMRNNEKEMYTVTFNKGVPDLNLSTSLQYSRQTYWDRGTSDYYTLSFNHNFTAFDHKNITAGLALTHSRYWGRNNDTAFLRFSVPLGTGMAQYGGSVNNKRFTHTVGYNSSFNHGFDSYSINTGFSNGGEQPTKKQISAYYSHNSAFARISTNISSVQNDYSSLGMSVAGGATLTAHGAAIHSGGTNGGTRLLVDTDGVSGVPVNGGNVRTNHWGIGVVTDIGSYYRNTTSVDLNKLADNVEATQSVVEASLTDGAIGYRKFGVLKGERLFAVLNKIDGGHPPFGASVFDKRGRELGIVGDDGLVWIAGVTAGEPLTVSWGATSECTISLPKEHKDDRALNLPCM